VRGGHVHHVFYYTGRIIFFFSFAVSTTPPFQMRLGARASAVTSMPEGSARRGSGRGGWRGVGRDGHFSGRGRGRGRSFASGCGVLEDRDAPDFAVRLSKRMSHLLRHGAVDAGLGDVMDAAGFLPLASVLALPRFAGITELDVRSLVANCPKRRFELREVGKQAKTSSTTSSDGTSRLTSTPKREDFVGSRADASDAFDDPNASSGEETHVETARSRVCIRATQGHTMRHETLDDDAMLTRLDEGACLNIREAAHGTSSEAWATIKKSGLSRMRRRHVHMALRVPEPMTTPRTESNLRDAFESSKNFESSSVASGFRKGARIAVWIDVARGVREGVPFFLSANDVVLSPGELETGCIPTRLFLRAVDCRTGEEVALE